MKKILLVRADRMGDVVLTTPVFQAIKEGLPDCYLALLVMGENQHLVRNHPFLDEVIAYDKKGLYGNNLLGFFLFAYKLRRQRFDCVIHFHPRARFYWLSYFAGIPVRIGYKYKKHSLLTQTLEYDKPQGKKHESEYNFDFLKLLRVKQPDQAKPVISLLPEFENVLDQFFNSKRPYAVFNPSASSPSKMWPAEYFAQVADSFCERHSFTPVIIGGPLDLEVSRKMERLMRLKAINLAGKLPLGVLPWLFKSSQIVLTNDTGPAHVAAAVDAKTLSIFLRNLPGLNPERWRPLGDHAFYVLEEVVKSAQEANEKCIQVDDIHLLTPSFILEKLESILCNRVGANV